VQWYDIKNDGKKIEKRNREKKYRPSSKQTSRMTGEEQKDINDIEKKRKANHAKKDLKEDRENHPEDVRW
jgi:hypothetical protein